jgi:hypothetical protein
MAKAKCCKNCKWAEWPVTKGVDFGFCRYPITAPKLPSSVSLSNLNYYKTRIWKGDGENCPCFKEKK